MLLLFRLLLHLLLLHQLVSAPHFYTEECESPHFIKFEVIPNSQHLLYATRSVSILLPDSFREMLGQFNLLTTVCIRERAALHVPTRLTHHLLQFAICFCFLLSPPLAFVLAFYLQEPVRTVHFGRRGEDAKINHAPGAPLRRR